MYILEILLDDSVSEDIKTYYKSLEEKETTDSGIDLVVCEDLNVPVFGIETIDFKIKCQLLDVSSNIYLPYYLYPRSSISKTPLIMANSVGIIDRDYRGNIMAKVRNIPINGNQDTISGEPYAISKNTRLFQLCHPSLSPIKVSLVDKLQSTTRGEGGFGSTGLGI